MLIRRLIVLCVASSAMVSAQTAPPPSSIPIRKLSAPTGVTKEIVRLPSGMYQFNDGRLIVNDALGKRLIVFDSTLATFTVSADSNGTGTTLYPPGFGVTTLFRYPGDSVVFPDAKSQAFIMIGPDGKLGRAFAHPKPRDMSSLSLGYAGSPGFDPKGRFFYRAVGGVPPRPATPGSAPPPARTRDSSALVRADFDSRALDTIAVITLPPPPSSTHITRDDDGKRHATTIVNPILQAPDEWAVLTDGTVAIVRPQDYHIDWISPDGKLTSTPKMAFDWRRITDEDKQARVDSVKRVIDSLSHTDHPYGMAFGPGAGGRIDTITPSVQFVPFSQMPDYFPPFRAGNVRADRDNLVWILPSTTLSASGGGLLYDVVSERGGIVERVQLPPGRIIGGFGPGGVVYLLNGNRDKGFTIEKTHIVR